MDGFKISNILEVVERSVFLRILGVCVENGYSPNINDSTLFPNTADGMAAYKAAILAIRQEKGFAVEIFNDAGISDRGDKEVPRIVIISEDFENGDIGHGFSTSRVFDEATQKYIPYKIPQRTSKFYYRVVLVGNRVKHYRIMNSLLAVALPTVSYITPYTNVLRVGSPILEATPLFNERVQQLSYDDAKTGTFERSYRYCINDLYEIDPDIQTGVAPIGSIMVHFFRDDKPILDMEINYETNLLASNTDVLASSDDLLSEV